MADALSPDWLERANRFALTSTLLATTVHEVNNALQVISGSAEMLAPASAPDVIARRTEAMGAHARRASALMAELSSFARDDVTNTARIDLGQAAQRALSMRQYAFARLKLESTFETRGQSRMVVANSRLILQVILNLIVNAERALENQPGGRIALVVTGSPEPVSLVVEDNGPGIAPDAEQKIFVAGALACQAHLGIGLAVSKQLIERFNGTVRYEAREEGGCRFRVELPASG
jgi:signal transduction histidine kinase